MKKERPDGLDVLFYVIIGGIAIAMLASTLLGCAASKTKQSSHVTLDSSSKQLEKRDTASRHDSVKVSKDLVSVILRSDTTHTKEETNIHQVKEVTKYDSSGKVKEYHKTTTDLTKKKDQATGGKLFIEDHSKIDSSVYKNHDSGSHEKSATVDLHKDQSQSSKQVKTSGRFWLWWLLLIPVCAWIWSNRSIIWGLLSGGLEWIKRIVVKLFTGP
jgi:hypothetical protein